MSNLDWYRKGIIIDGKYFSHLRFADYTVVSEFAKQLEEMLNDLRTVNSKVSLEMDTLKPKMAKQTGQKKK